MKGSRTIFLFFCFFLVAGESRSEAVQNYSSVSTLLARHPELVSRQMSIMVRGRRLKSTYGKLDCVYHESAEIYYRGEDEVKRNQWNTLGSRSSTKEPFDILIEDRFRLTVEPSSTLRLFIGPSYQRSFARQKEHGRQVDYCLQEGKKYFMRIQQEEIDYGPPDASGNRASSTYYFIQISDQEFKNNLPQVEPTPTFHDWIYGHAGLMASNL